MIIGSKYFCDKCKIYVKNNCWVAHLRTIKHKTQNYIALEEGIGILRSAFKDRIITYKVSPQNYTIDIKLFQEEIKNKVLTLIRREQLKHRSVKINFELYGIYYSKTLDLMDVKSFNTKFEVVVNATDIEELYENLFVVLSTKADEFAERESGKKKTL